MKLTKLRIGQVARSVLALAFAAVGLTAVADIGFTLLDEDWRTLVQITAKGTAGRVYEPLSVFTSNDAVAVSFGYTNKTEATVAIPDVRLSLQDESKAEILKWIEPANGETIAPHGVDCKVINCDVLALCAPGNYRLKVELGTESEYFRFAVRDPELIPEIVLAGSKWTDAEVKPGNGFAQAPHAANAQAIQFGPYTPMNKILTANRKKPLDLVFLIDCTGSMGGCIDGLKKNITDFFGRLIEGDAENPPITDWRAKVVGYRDVTCDSPWYEDHSFTEDVPTFNAQIAECRATGGGDWEESLLDSLYLISTKTEFRPEATRIIVAFTDAPHRTYMDAPGCPEHGDVTDAIKAMEANGIILKLVASTTYGEIESVCDTENAEFTYTPSLDTFTGDVETMRKLATSVSSSVETEIVEPLLRLRTDGPGRLMFDWKNDSSADTNNVFTFRCIGEDGTVTNETLDAGAEWKSFELPLDSGSHTAIWTYTKLFYNGDVADCGVITNLVWEPYDAHLEVTPEEMFFDSTGTLKSDPVAVECNVNWRTAGAVDTNGNEAAWITVSASGTGNGSFTFKVAECPSTEIEARTAFVVIEALKDGKVTATRRVKVVQEPPTDVLRILDIGVKPRWPWNAKVDIDFRVIAPKGYEGPINLTVTGWDHQGVGCGFPAFESEEGAMKVPGNSNQASVAGGKEKNTGIEIVADDNNLRLELSKGSGTYRVTWDLTTVRSGKEYSHVWSEGTFHTPDFRVIIEGTAGEYAATGVSKEGVRVDARRKQFVGGFVATGQEKIGHPNGLMDPFPWNSEAVANGAYSLTNLFVAVVSGDDFKPNKNDPSQICVLNGDVAVEGGVIRADTAWTAGRIHLVRDNVIVAEGATLTIEDGAIVKFCEATRILCHRDDSGKGSVKLGGAYVAWAHNPLVGGDTLYGTSSKTNTNVITYGNDVFVNEIYPTKPSNNYNLLSYTRKEIFCLRFCAGSESGSNQAWTRYYSVDEKYGVLPRPCAEGEQFLGWFKGDDPWSLLKTNEDKGWTYTNILEWLVKEDDVLTDFVPYETKNYLYAMSAKPGYFGYDITYPKADGSKAKIVLDWSSKLYNGEIQKPEVKSVKVGVAEVPLDDCEIKMPDSTEPGVYDVTVTFKRNYDGEAKVRYRITPVRDVEPEISFEPDCYVYTGAEFKPPTVKVTVGGKATTFDYEWSEGGNWTDVGKHVCKVTLTGRYSGEASAVFEIRKRPPEKTVTVYTSAKEVNALLEKGIGDKRVLCVSGDDKLATRAILWQLTDVTAVSDYVAKNYVCWFDKYGEAGSFGSLFAPSCGAKDLPFLGVFDPVNCGVTVAETNGYMSAGVLKAFLEGGKSAPEPVAGEEAFHLQMFELWPDDDPTTFDVSTAHDYVGYVRDADGRFAGVVSVHTTPSAKKDSAAVKVSLTKKSGTTVSYKDGVCGIDGSVTNLPSGTPEITSLMMSGNAIGGKIGSDGTIVGARKDIDVPERYQDTWFVRLADGSELKLVINAKGEAKLSGNTADGYAVAVTAPVIVGADGIVVPMDAVLKRSGKLDKELMLLLESSVDDAGEDTFTVLDSSDDVKGVEKPKPPEFEEVDATVYLTVGVACESENRLKGDPAAKFAAKGLPAGLKIDAASGVVSGVPTKAGTFEGVTLTATSTADSTMKGEADRTYVVETLPDWAVGTFNGEVKVGEDETPGLATLTVSKTGGISGKYTVTEVVSGKAKTTSYSLTAKSFASGSDDEGVFTAECTFKMGTSTVTNWIELTCVDLDGVEQGEMKLAGAAAVGWAYQDVWSAKDEAVEDLREPFQTAWSVSCGEGDYAGTALQIKVDAKGKAKVEGTVGGVKVSTSVQTVLRPDDDSGVPTLVVPVYVTLKEKGEPDDVEALRISLRSDGDGDVFSVKADEDLSESFSCGTVKRPAFESDGWEGPGPVLTVGVACAVTNTWSDASAVKFTATGLPAGLKIDAATGVVSGVPTKAASFTVKLTATSTVDSTLKGAAERKYVVLPLPDWAVGTFNGEVKVGEDETPGLATLTVSKTGGISGKYTVTDIVSGKAKTTSYSLKAKSFASGSDDEGVFTAECTFKMGTSTVTNWIELTCVDLDGVEQGEMKLAGAAAVGWAYQDVWSAKDEDGESLWKDFREPWIVSGEGDYADTDLSIKVDAKGKAKVSGTIGGVTVSASVQTVLCPDDDSGVPTLVVPVYVTLKEKGEPDDVEALRISLRSDGDGDVVSVKADEDLSESFSCGTVKRPAFESDGWEDPGPVLTVGVACAVVNEWENDAEVKYTATGLPAGLKIDAKTGVVSGVPTKAASFTVKLTATSTADSTLKGTAERKYVVEKLPDWAVGTFNGEAEVDGNPGLATLTVTAAGGISGKYEIADGKGGKKTYSLSAKSYAQRTDDGFLADVVVKSGSIVVCTNQVTVSGVFFADEVFRGEMALTDTEGAAVGCAYQNLWLRKGTPLPPTPVFVGTPVYSNEDLLGELTLKFGSKGVVTLGGKIDDAKVSGSAQLALTAYDEESGYSAVLVVDVPKADFHGIYEVTLEPGEGGKVAKDGITVSEL